MKKLLLSLGALASIIAPVVSVISCGKSTGAEQPTATGTEQPTPSGVDKTADSIKDKLDVVYKEASLQTSIEKTDHDFIRVGGPSLRILGNGIPTLKTATLKEHSQDKLGEFRSGDYFEFIFKDASEIKSFSERVKYVDGSSKANAGIFASDNADNLDDLVTPSYIQSGKSIYSEGIKLSSDESVKKSLFTITAVKKNVIRMTFNNILKEGQILSNQKLLVKGFEDSNKDGKIDDSDIETTLPFFVTPNRFTNDNHAFWNSGFYSNKNNILAKGVHLPDLFKILNDDLKQAKYQAKLNTMRFDQKDINWGEVDLTKLKDGDVIKFIGNGMPQVLRVFSVDGKFHLVFDNGTPGDNYNGGILFGPLTVVDKTHFSHPCDRKQVVGPAPHYEITFKDTPPEVLEVTNMGTL